MPLLNLPSPPDGFSFSLNGLGQQTGTLIKSTASLLNDTAKKIVGSIPKPPENVFAPGADTNGPSLTATMADIKSGAINKDITASLAKINSVAGSLPTEIGNAVAEAQAAVAAKMAEAQAQLPKLLAIAQANMELTTKTSLANGTPPTEAQLKAASGSLAIFQDGPAALKAQAESISKKVAEAGKDFGAKLPAALDTASNFAKAGLDKISSLATSAGSSISSFASTVPPQSIPDPFNPNGPPIANPAYASFIANPTNASKVSSLNSLSSNLATAAAGLTSAFAVIEAKANTAVSGGIADLKAFAAAAQFAQPAGGIMAAARSISIDATKVSAAQINKVVAQSAAGSVATSPKADDASVKETKLSEPAQTTATATKTGIFDKDPNEKISESFVEAYADHWRRTNAYLQTLTAKATFEAKLNAFYPGYVSLKERAVQIVKDKPDPDSRTAEETYYIDKRAKLKGLVDGYFIFYRGIIKTQSQLNERATQYKLLKNLFEQNKTYGDCPKSIETAIRTSAVLSDAEEASLFMTYADLKKAKPELALPDALEAPFTQG
jgi:hypothetical protein